MGFSPYIKTGKWDECTWLSPWSVPAHRQELSVCPRGAEGRTEKSDAAYQSQLPGSCCDLCGMRNFFFLWPVISGFAVTESDLGLLSVVSCQWGWAVPSEGSSSKSEGAEDPVPSFTSTLTPSNHRTN